ncbi:MAG: hypothetical protein ACREQ5_02155 [Candidatus Dormibacteria bacterium]
MSLLVGLLSALAWIPGVYALVDGLRHRKKAQRKDDTDGEWMVVTSALELLAPYRKRVEELESLVLKVSDQLVATNKRAEELSSQLIEAQVEVVHLRSQVATLKTQLA